MTSCESVATRSATETEALGSRLAAEMRGGDVVLLEAELAAGKTTFVRGLVQGLGGDPTVVSSPTFVLIQSYDDLGAEINAVHHVDLYRLNENTTDLRETGLEDALSDPTAVTVIEWPKTTIAAWIPADGRIWRVSITIEAADNRKITIEWPGWRRGRVTD